MLDSAEVKNKLYTKPKRASQMGSDTNYAPLANQTSNLNEQRNEQHHRTAFGMERANYERALENKKENSNLYYKGEEVPFGVDREHFKIYGPGIYLFFEFIWKLSLLFLVLSAISLIPIVYNYMEGTRFANSTTSLEIYISQISIANFYGDDPSLTSSEQVTASEIPRLVNVVSDVLVCVVVMLFYFYWTNSSESRTEELKKTIKLTNYYAIELIKFPESATQENIREFFSRFGSVTEVAEVRNYSETIELSKEIYEFEVQIKELRIEESENSNVDHSAEKGEIQQKIDKLYQKLEKEQRENKEQVIKYYVSFETLNERVEVLKKFSKVYTWCSFCSRIPDEYLLNGQKVAIVPCHNQPGEILWENVHITWKTRWIRYLLQTLLLLVFVCLGFFIISTLNIVTPPSETSSIDTSSYTTTTILSESNATIVESWCLKNIDDAYSTSALEALCSDYITNYYYNLALTYGITAVVVVVKLLLKHLVIFVARFQRYKEHTEESIDIVKNLVIIYIITTVIIGFLLQAQLFGITFKNLIPELFADSTLQSNADELTDYSELTNYWYKDIGYQIWFTWLILAFSPHIAMPLFHYGMECLNGYLAKKELLQRNMEKALQAEEFEIEDHYANIVMVFLVGLTFSGGMPVILILCFIGIITRYVYFKWIFIRFSRVPKTIDEALNDTVLSYFPWALVFHFIMTVWMYSATEIFAAESSTFSEWVSSSDNAIVVTLSSILEKALNSYYYCICALAIMFVILLKETVYDLVTFCMGNEVNVEEINKEQDSANGLIQTMKSQRGITSSYKIENNPDYFEIMSIRDKIANRNKQALNASKLGEIQM